MEEAPTTPIPAPSVLQASTPPTLTASLPLPPPPAPPSFSTIADRDSGRKAGGAAGAGATGSGGSGGAVSGSGGSAAGGRLGLTKEVLSAHTQQEEQNFLCRFKDLSQLQVFDPSSVLKRQPTKLLTRGKIISQHSMILITIGQSNSNVNYYYDKILSQIFWGVN